MGKQTNFYVLGILLLGSLFYSGCATNPVSGKKDFVLMSEAQEINLGKQAHQQVMKQYRPYNDPALQSYVEGLVDELGKKSHRANLVYHVTVLDSPQINAFALPGGYLYITRGIMAYMNSEAELAGVLGHELGHITARHGVRQQSAGTVAGILGAGVGILTGSGQAAQAANIGSTALIRGYGRSHELEADRLGAEYLANVGYDPQEMLNVVEILKDQEEFDKQLAKEEGREPRAYHGTFSTHPANDARLQEVVGAANNIKTAATREAGREKFLKYMDGAVLGTSEQDGVIRKNKFYHTDLNLFVEFPEGWKVDNLPDRLIAQPKTGDAQLQITVDDLNKKQTPKEYLNEQFKGQISNGQPVQTANFQGYTGYTNLTTKGGKVPSRVAAVFQGKRIYQVLIAGKDGNALNKYDAAGLTTIKSMRQLKNAERKLAKPKNIKLIRAKSGDTFASLAKRSDIATHAEEQLRLLNGMYPDGEPKAGQLIKIVQ
ncbi:MAG: M48 family metalloprotease [Gammaproteobacteria bacterium]|nr:M48 family metalloprotease [Gammaproteobacteria bacterium]